MHLYKLINSSNFFNFKKKILNFKLSLMIDYHNLK